MKVDVIAVRLAASKNHCYFWEAKTRTKETVKELVLVPCVTNQEIAKHLTQLDIAIDGEVLLEEMNVLIAILLTDFRDGWELEYEKVALNSLRYEYKSNNLNDLKLRKGDVSKDLTLKHRDRV